MLFGISELYKGKKQVAWKFSLAVLFVLPLAFSVAYAETGKNFDRQIIGIDENGLRTYHWTSHYERIWDGNSWVNYILNETDDTIIFESANMNYKFHKDSCEFSLYNPVTKALSIESFQHNLTINGIEVTLSSCNITELNLQNDLFEFKVVRTTTGGELDTKYQIKPNGEMEWTHEIKNTDLFQIATFGVKETCINCEPIKTEGDTIFFDDYYLDTKNIIHNTLKTIEADKTDLKLTYESEPISFFDKVVIDPVFGYSTGTDYRVLTTSVSGTACGTPNTKSTALPIRLYREASGSAGLCELMSSRWDISSIPDDAIITDSKIRYDIEAISNPINCDWREINNDPTPASATTLWNDILDGTIFISNSSDCTTVANDKVLDLGTSGDSDIDAQLPSNWWAVGVSFVSMTRDATARIIEQDTAAGGDTAQIELQVTYSYQPVIAYPENVDVTIIGDKARISGNMYVNAAPSGNITSQKLFVNGTLSQYNQTIHNSTAIEPYRVNFGPYWYRMVTDSVYNFTMQIQAQQNSTVTITNQSSVFESREYEPDYFDAEVPSQGLYNYSYNGGTFKVNRNVTGTLNETWQIECKFRDWGAVFTNSTVGTWVNETNIGAFDTDLIQNTDYYVTCYNDDLLFGEVPLYSDFGNYIGPGMAIFDQLGGFLGAPAALLFIFAIFSWGTGRNFPVVLIIGVSALALMGALSLLILEDQIWGIILVLAGIGIFGIRKFF